MVNLPIITTLIIFNVINVLLHGIGIHLLYCVHRVGEPNVQNVFILNLSITELIMNLCEIFRRLFHIFSSHSFGPSSASTLTSINRYLSIVMFTGVSVVFYLTMAYITIDRLLHIALSIRYKLYWSAKKAKRLLIVTWCFGALIGIGISIAKVLFNYNWSPLFYMYIYPIFEISFIILAFSTYLFIFLKYKKSCRVTVTRRSGSSLSDRRASNFQIFQKSKFFVPVLIILSFVIFMFIPDMVYLFIGIVNKKESEVLLASCWISYAVSNAVDACIYIFMKESVRTLLWEKTNHFLKLITCSINTKDVVQQRPRFLTDISRVQSPRPRSKSDASSRLSRSRLTSSSSIYRSEDLSNRSRLTSDASSYRSRLTSDASSYRSRLASDVSFLSKFESTEAGIDNIASIHPRHSKGRVSLNTNVTVAVIVDETDDTL